jgi:DNA-binding transcriptional LysR family regulator
VVASHHPLASIPAPVSRTDLAEVTQLVLTDSTSLTQALRGNLIGRRLWRFADLQTRLDYLLAGFGWCNMPLHVVEPHLASGQLIRLRLAEDTGFVAQLFMVHDRTRPPGRAGKWLANDLRQRLMTQR